MSKEAQSSLISSKNLMVTGGEFGATHHHYGQDTRQERAIEMLYKKTIPGALHNSAERYENHPKCHENTRVAIRNEILDWMDILDDEQFAMWISGAAGSGKSAICQLIAEILFERQRLSGSFFFSRDSQTGRNSAAGLVATLAHQILIEIPETRPFIADAIVGNSLLLDLSWKVQLESLIVNPLYKVARSLPSPYTGPPRLLIIDGLDECNGEESQCSVIQIFMTTMHKIQGVFPHKLLFASRHERHLVSTFEGPNISPHLMVLRLDDSWEPNNDIRLFLTDSFAELKKNHPASKSLDPHWPSYTQIERLVTKSSGQFIYAATVIRYVGSRRLHPTDSLKHVLGLFPNVKNKPFAELDALYRHIFSCSDDLHTLLRILCIDKITHMDPLTTAQHVLGLSEGMVELHLSVLSSVVEIVDVPKSDSPDSGSRPGRQILYLHASLQDFLRMKTRAGPFHLYSTAVVMPLLDRCLTFYRSISPISVAGRSDVCFSAPVFLSHQINHYEDRAKFLMAISQSNFKALLDYASRNFGEHTASELTSHFLPWLAKQYDQLSHSKKLHLIDEVIRKITTWMKTELQQFPFNGFDNVQSIDLTVFAMVPSYHIRESAFPVYLRILGHDDHSDIVPSNGMLLCWKMLPNLPKPVLQDVSLFGDYAMKRERYADAALHGLRFLILTKARTEERLYSDGFVFILDAIRFFMEAASAQQDLFLFCLDLCFQDDVENQLSALRSDEESGLDQRHKLFHQISWNVTTQLGLADLHDKISWRVVEYIQVICLDMPAPSKPRKEQVFYHVPEKPLWAWSGTSMRWASWLEINILGWIDSR